MERPRAATAHAPGQWIRTGGLRIRLRVSMDGACIDHACFEGRCRCATMVAGSFHGIRRPVGRGYSVHESSSLRGDAVRLLIRTALSSTTDTHLMHRLDAVLLVAEGLRCGAVAGWFGVDRRTVERWVHAAAVAGIDGLAEHRHGGRPPRLTQELMQRLRLDLQGTPASAGRLGRAWSGKRLASHLADRYGVDMSVRNCQRLIARCRANAASHP